MIVQIGRFHRGISESVATGETAATAIRPGHGLLNQLDARILLNLEALGHKIEGQREQQAET